MQVEKSDIKEILKKINDNLTFLSKTSTMEYIRVISQGENKSSIFELSKKLLDQIKNKHVCLKNKNGGSCG